MLLTRGWGGRIRRIPSHVRPRRFRLFGLGDAKTGTERLAHKFSRYRSVHEWDRSRLVPASSAVLEGRLPVSQVRTELRRRSRWHTFELDCAYFLAPFAGELAEMHDDAQFVLLVRDCFSWLEARVDYVRRVPLTPVGRESMAARYGHYDEPLRGEEAALHDAGLYPITSYLRYWAELPAKVMRDVPADRLCIVRTDDLDQSNERLASFVGIDPANLLPAPAVDDEPRNGLLATVPDESIVELAVQHCAPLMQRFWGDDWVSLQSRLRPPPST